MIGKRKKSPAVFANGNGQSEAASNNPYLNAREEWLERYGSYIQRARQWRLSTMLALAIALASIVGNVYQLTQNKIDRYWIVVDELGKTVAEKMKSGGSTPEKVVQATVAQMIVDWRSVTVDKELQKQMINRVNMHVAGTARGMVKEWYESNSPYEVAKKGRLVNVEILGVPLAVSKDSYRVEWREVVRSIQGIELLSQQYEAIVTISIIPPQTDEVVLQNPGGVYIINLSTAKRLN